MDDSDDSDDNKYSGDDIRGEAHSSPYPVSRMGAPVSLVEMARVIESASAKVALRTKPPVFFDARARRTRPRRPEIQGFVSGRLLKA